MKKNKCIISILSVLFCVLGILFSSCSWAQTFETNGMKITLTSNFVEKSHVEFTAYYTSKNMIVAIIKEDYYDIKQAGKDPENMTRESYLLLLRDIYGGNLKNESQTVKEDGLVYFTYENDAFGKDFKVLCCAYKSSTSYYSVQFSCHKNDFNKLEKTILQYAKSVELEGANQLTFTKLVGKEEYCVSGKGTVEDEEIIVPSEYKGLPVTAIGKEAFKNRSFKKITLPETITEIQDSAFYSCYNMEEIVLGNNVKHIGKFSFSFCGSLAKFPLQDSVETIGKGAFQNCNSFVEITLPKNLIAIEESCFTKCEKLETVVFPSKLNKIGAHAFEECKKLKAALLPATLTTIENSAFKRCESLTEIVIPDSVVSLGYFAFAHTGLKKASLGTGITELSHGLFWYCEQLNSVIFSDNVAIIKERAFERCSQLKEISSMKNVRSIERYAFEACNRLKSVSFSSQLRDIGENAFKDCSVLSNVSLPEGLTSVGVSCFESCLGLTEIVLPNSLTTLGEKAFYRCENLEKVKIGNGLEEIHKATFGECAKLSEAEFSESLKQIGEKAFIDCDGLLDIRLPDSLTQMYKNAFDSCKSLETIAFGKSLKNILVNESAGANGSLFTGCNKLNSISVSLDNEYYQSIDGDLYTKDGKTLIRYAIGKEKTTCEIPENVNEIGDSAFYGCSSLQQVKLPVSLTVINDFAFAFCSRLNRVELPYGIEKIEEMAFSSCYALKEIVLPYGVDLAIDVFYNCTALTIYCENASLPLHWGESVERVFTHSTVVWGHNNVKTNTEFDYVIHGETICLTKFKGNASEVVIPAEIDGYKVVDIGTIFAKNTGIISVKIPEGITKIEQKAFIGCKVLISVELPKSLTEIKEKAFEECRSLLELVIPKNVERIEKEAFAFCDLLKTVVFLDDVEFIDDFAFSSSFAINSVYYKGDNAKGKLLYDNNYSLRLANWYYYSETQPIDDGDYWHYNEDNEIVVWEKIT